jgi:CRISPR/Cas system-associated protein Csx1
MTEGESSKPVTVYVPPTPPLRERLNEIKNKMKSEPDDFEEVDKEIIESIRTFFLVSDALIEERTATLVYSEVVDEDVKSSEVRQYFNGEARVSMSQSHRENLLHASGIISGELLSSLQKARSGRNAVAHEYNFHLRNEWEGDLENKAELAVEAFEDLLDLTT